MRYLRTKKLILFLVICALTSGLVMWLVLKFEVDELIEDVPYNKELRVFLIKRLVRVDHLTFGSCKSGSESDALIYVLGGAQENLKHRFKTAANLYHRGIGKKILILSEPGITEYDPVIQRNLTNDEWAIKQLVDLRVRRQDIEPVQLEEGFLGTFAEAKGISALVLKRGCKHLALVSSPSHTMRVWVTFSGILNSRGTCFYIYGSDEDASLRNFLLEYFKLLVYQYVIMPVTI